METGQEKDFTSVSPSAKALLLLKGMTDIPYMKRVAELISAPEKYTPDFSIRNFTFWIRVLHFEHRYKTINQLLKGMAVKNILELSSGFSFRGLAAVQERDVHYIDTDLPDIIATKEKFVSALQGAQQMKGKLELLPLNAIDEGRFKEVVGHFDNGPLAIVNEGLLMYLNIEEKRKLCGIIHNVLKERGGCWITADVYVKGMNNYPQFRMTDELEKFLEEHHVEDNKFESFEDAGTFFKSEGFIVDKEAEPEYANSKLLGYMQASISPEQAEGMRKGGDKVQATWRLRV